MRKIIVLSVNENPIYQFTLPLVAWSWKRIGWTPYIIMITDGWDLSPLQKFILSMINGNKYFTGIIMDEFQGYRSDTIAQVSRLYASIHCHENDYVMTGDSDMMALADYWKFDPEKITVWGHDLTNYQQMPICYIGMMATRWIEVMDIVENISISIKRDLSEMPDSGENGNQVNRWCTDQRLITQRINETQFEKEFVHRGTLANGYPVGRIDRSAWATYHPNPIDCHLPHDIHYSDEAFLKVMRMLSSVFPDDDFTWFADYREEFKKILQ